MIYIKNISGEIKKLHLHEFQVDEIYQIPEIDRKSWADNDDVIAAITNGVIEIHDVNGVVSGLSKQIDTLKAKLPVTIDNPKAPDGKNVYQVTPRKLGTYAYYSGSGDDPEDVFNIGGDSEDVQLIYGEHNLEDDLIKTIYRDLNTIANETHIRTGVLQWSGAKNDYITFEIVPRLTEYEAGENTNFNIYANTLIVPAAGNGLITPTNIELVECVANEYGTKPAGFWDATFNMTTGQFENITPRPYGNGNYNMFVAEMIFSRFVNKFMLLGDGLHVLPSDDITQVPHGGRVKITTKTRGEDHAWSWNANIHLYRKRTC